jgi:hypothetical protein
VHVMPPLLLPVLLPPPLLLPLLLPQSAPMVTLAHVWPLLALAGAHSANVPTRVVVPETDPAGASSAYPGRSCHPLPTYIATRSADADFPPRSAASYTNVNVAGWANVVPAGPTTYAVPIAPAAGDAVAMTVIETLSGSAPSGIVTLSEPSLDEAVPPFAPMRVVLGPPGGFWEEPPEQRTTARTTSAPPARRNKSDLSFMATTITSP